jgi:RHS repeat-associated protein
MSNKSPLDRIAVPSGGGALKGLDEKFTPDLFTGAGNYRIPIELPPGRNGFTPALALGYASTNGSSAFGLGWTLGVPSITRKTAKGAPHYDDRDTFLLAGEEDLVRVADSAQYRPRTDTSHARITHVVDAGADHWEVRQRDGSISFYGVAGADEPPVLADPARPDRRFAWKLTETRDSFGNRIVFDYERDPVRSAGRRRWDQLYLSRIRYCDYGDPSAPRFLVTVRLIYEERPDPTSDHRAGFEVRTLRRCTRIEISTDAGAPNRVRTYHLRYADQLGAAPATGSSLLAEVRVEGHDDEAGTSESRPPLRFGYGDFDPAARRFRRVTGELPARSLAHGSCELVDLRGTGLPDILELDGEARVWPNLGDGRFGRPYTMRAAPPLRLADPGVQLIDADGDGRVDLLISAPGLSGYYPIGDDGEWDQRSFVRYERGPSFDLEDREVRLLDLDGNGATDAVRTGTAIERYFNDPRDGWTTASAIPRESIDGFSGVSFSDPRVKLADLTGDGATDLVLVLDGRVDYWPGLGHGDFGARRTMHSAPRLPLDYDPRRILMGDVDGDGVADLVYVDDRKVTLWLNRAGNAWSPPIEISGTPSVSDVDAIRLVDLLGTGVRGLLWSRDASAPGDGQMFFLDFCGGTKPYLLERIDNSAGATTTIGYAPSTRFRLADQARGEPWRTAMPFPMQVVARMEAAEAFSETVLAIEYRYHHGFWDGVEREFRGFGRVDRRDAELAADGAAASPPTELRTWFHLGAIDRGDRTVAEFDHTGDYWPGDPPAFPAAIDPGATTSLRARRDAFRALRGKVLRTELYSLDASQRAIRPYTVEEHNHAITLRVAPSPDGTRPAVWFPFETATRTTQWERGEDPMTRLTLTGDHDVYGQPRQRCAIAVPRGRDFRRGAPPEASPFLVTHTVTVRAVLEDDVYLVDRVSHATTYEIVEPDSRSSAFDLWQRIQTASPPDTIIEQLLHYYDGDDFLGLPLGRIGPHGALIRSEQLVLTEALLQDAYRGDATAAIPPYLRRDVTWPDEYPVELRHRIDRLLHAPPIGEAVLGGYVRHGGDGPVPAPGYFATTACRLVDRRGLVTAERDALGNQTTIQYDDFARFPIRVTDPTGLVVAAIYDNRVSAPLSITDPNANVTEMRYTPLGLVASVAVLGKPEHPGDSLDTPSTAFEYHLDEFERTGQPMFVHTRRRVHRSSELDVPSPQRDQLMESRQYWDGLGRALQTRVLAEDFLFGDVRGDAVLSADQTESGPAIGQRRADDDPVNVAVSGWQSYDHRGRIVEKYEPCFASGWDYRAPSDAERGARSRLFYDALDRIVRTVLADGSEERTIFGRPHDLAVPDDHAPTPWERFLYDANDNAGRTQPKRADPAHWNTPTSETLDALGRIVKRTVRAGATPAQWTVTRTDHDIRSNVRRIYDVLGRGIAFAYSYDLTGRRLRTEQLDGGTRRTIYGATGDLIERRDAKGALFLEARDADLRPTHRWARDRADEPVTLREHLVYGGDAELSIDDPGARNLLGRLRGHYDEAGLLVVSAYDVLGNPVEQTRRVIADDELLHGFEAALPDWRRLAYCVDWQGALDDRAAAILDPTEHITSRRHDALGRVRVLDHPSDATGARHRTRYRYGRGGGLEQVTLDDRIVIEHVAYNARGQRTLVIYAGPNLMTRYAYDASARLVRLRTEGVLSTAPLTFVPSGSVLQDSATAYDLAGNPTSLHERSPGCGVPGQPDRLDRTFTYDPLYRLTSATGREADVPLEAPWVPTPRTRDVSRTRPYRWSYAYDAADNLLAISAGGGPVRHYQLADGSNRLAAMNIGETPFEYEYDACGNLLRETTSRRCEWNHHDRLRTFAIQAGEAGPSLHVQFLYDDRGRRIKKLVRKQGGRIESTVYIEDVFEQQLTRTADATQIATTVHVFDGGRRVVELQLGGDAEVPAMRFHLDDRLGNSEVVVGADGDWVSREEYSPHGETTFGSFARKRYRVAGRERDEESGFCSFAARCYAPWLSRWISTDPAESVDGANLFAYVRNNPIRYRDAGGREAHEPITGSAYAPRLIALPTPPAPVLDYLKPPEPKPASTMLWPPTPESAHDRLNRLPNAPDAKTNLPGTLVLKLSISNEQIAGAASSLRDAASAAAKAGRDAQAAVTGIKAFPEVVGRAAAREFNAYVDGWKTQAASLAKAGESIMAVPMTVGSVVTDLYSTFKSIYSTFKQEPAPQPSSAPVAPPSSATVAEPSRAPAPPTEPTPAPGLEQPPDGVDPMSTDWLFRMPLPEGGKSVRF